MSDENRKASLYKKDLFGVLRTQINFVFSIDGNFRRCFNEFDSDNILHPFHSEFFAQL